MSPRMVFIDSLGGGQRETIVWCGYKSIYNVLETILRASYGVINISLDYLYIPFYGFGKIII